jgi:PKD repeat protein
MRKGLLFILLIFCITIKVTANSGDTRPYHFVENKGQWPAEVRFRADLEGGKLWVMQDRLRFQWYDGSVFRHAHDHPKDHTSADSLVHIHAYDVVFVNGNAQGFTREQQATFLSNYFYGNDIRVSNARAYESITLEDIWPGINLRLYRQNGGLKYDLQLDSGVNPGLIQFEYLGQSDLKLEGSSLLIETSIRSVREAAPVSWQIIKEKKVSRSFQYSLEGNRVRFVSESSISSAYPLIIDPALIFSTYSGSFGDNWGNTAAFDEQGRLYSGGTAFEPGFPAQPGAYDLTFNGVNPATNYGFGIDVAILLFSSDGRDLEAATYLGGFLTEMPFSIGVNENEVYLMGATSSGFIGSPFPTTSGAYDQTFNGGNYVNPVGGVYFNSGSDIFVSKFDLTLSSLLYSTYVGGPDNDGIQYDSEILTKNYGDHLRGDILTDDFGNVYVASYTHSTSGLRIIGVPGADSTYNGGVKDGILFSLSNTLSTMRWFNYAGGSGEDALYSIQLGKRGEVFVTGGTTSSDVLMRGTPLKNTYGGQVDAFVMRYSADGDTLLKSTYLGTNDYDQAYFIQIDTSGQVYVAGQTSGAYPIFPTNIFQVPESGLFFQKLDTLLSTSIYSSVFGSGGFQPNFSPTAFLVNECENLFISGWGGALNEFYIGGSTTNLPVTSNAWQSITDGSDFYLAVFPKNLSAGPIYATYFGGIGIDEHVDGGTSRFDKRGIVYHATCAGCGGSDLFPTFPNPGAWSNTNNSFNCNNGAFKFDLSNLKADFIPDVTQGCDTLIVSFTNTSQGGSEFEWQFGDGETSNSGSTVVVHIYKQPGTYTVKLIATDLTTCIGKDTAEATIVVHPLPEPDVNIEDTIICVGDTIQLNASFDASYTYEWSPNEDIDDISIHNPLVWPKQNKRYIVTVTDQNNCQQKDTVNVFPTNISGIIQFEDLRNCGGELNYRLFNESFGVNLQYLWDLGDGTSAQGQEIFHQYKKPGQYQIIVNLFNLYCAGADTIDLDVARIRYPNLLTPNKDGLNDAYVIQGAGEGFTFEVFNAWGDRVYTRENYTNQWRAEGLADGVYYYRIVSPDGTECKGWVQLLGHTGK